MASLKSALMALALTTSADAKRNRRLADRLDVAKIAEDAEEGKLSSRVLFKIDDDHRDDASAVADKVATILECDSAPTRVFRDAGKFERGHKAAGLDLHYQVECGKGAAASKETFAALMKFLDSDDHQGVALVEPEYDEELLWTPDDPSLGTQDHYPAIKLEQAWDYTTGSPDVVVQVLDTGIDMSHPDLQMNIWRNEGEICGDGVDNDGNGFVDDVHGWNFLGGNADVQDSDGHGTHCAGTIAAAYDDNGIDSVAAGFAKLMAIKFM